MMPPCRSSRRTSPALCGRWPSALRGSSAARTTSDAGGLHDRDLARIGPQVAALEERVEQLRQRLSQPPTATDEQAERASSLLDEVRREHSQVRMRVTTLVKYEERIRQLEDEVAGLRAAAQLVPKN